MGGGKLQGPCRDLIEVPAHMVCNSTKDLENNVFDDFEKNRNNVKYLSQRAIMSPRNDFIDEKRIESMKRIPGEMKISYSRDSCVEDDDNTMHEPDILNRINGSGVPPH